MDNSQVKTDIPIFSVNLTNFIENKKADGIESEAILNSLIYTERYSRALGSYEVGFEENNHPKTFKIGFELLESYAIQYRYRTKDGRFDYWTFNGTIFRQNARAQSRCEIDMMRCPYCGTKNSKYRADCRGCGNPLGA